MGSKVYIKATQLVPAYEHHYILHGPKIQQHQSINLIIISELWDFEDGYLDQKHRAGKYACLRQLVLYKNWLTVKTCQNINLMYKNNSNMQYKNINNAHIHVVCNSQIKSGLFHLLAHKHSFLFVKCFRLKVLIPIGFF